MWRWVVTSELTLTSPRVHNSDWLAPWLMPQSHIRDDRTRKCFRGVFGTPRGLLLSFRCYRQSFRLVSGGRDLISSVSPEFPMSGNCQQYCKKFHDLLVCPSCRKTCPQAWKHCKNPVICSFLTLVFLVGCSPFHKKSRKVLGKSDDIVTDKLRQMSNTMLLSHDRVYNSEKSHKRISDDGDYRNHKSVDRHR